MERGRRCSSMASHTQLQISSMHGPQLSLPQHQQHRAPPVVKVSGADEWEQQLNPAWQWVAVALRRLDRKLALNTVGVDCNRQDAPLPLHSGLPSLGARRQSLLHGLLWATWHSQWLARLGGCGCLAAQAAGSRLRQSGARCCRPVRRRRHRRRRPPPSCGPAAGRGCDPRVCDDCGLHAGCALAEIAALRGSLQLVLPAQNTWSGWRVFDEQIGGDRGA